MDAPKPLFLWSILLVPLLLGTAPARADVVATGHDAVTTPGTPVPIRAKFERGLIGLVRPDLVREQVRLTVLGRSSLDLTDGEGIAEASALPRQAGVFPIEARLVRRKGPVARGHLFVFPRELPVAVVDIDGTLSDMGLIEVLFKGAEAPAFEHAPAVLEELARTHAVVYLTARDDVLSAPTREFLRRHRFPVGPVLFNELGLRGEALSQLAPGNHGEFKLRVIETLRARGLRVVVGIGNAETDGFAYEAAGLKSYLRTEEPGEGPSFRFTDYRVLERRLREDGVLPPAEAAPAPQEGAAEGEDAGGQEQPAPQEDEPAPE